MKREDVLQNCLYLLEKTPAITSCLVEVRSCGGTAHFFNINNTEYFFSSEPVDYKYNEDIDKSMSIELDLKKETMHQLELSLYKIGHQYKKTGTSNETIEPLFFKYNRTSKE